MDGERFRSNETDILSRISRIPSLSATFAAMRKLSMEELGRLTAEEFRAAGKFPVVAVLDNIRSMHNVGSIFRTADAFRIEKMLLCGYTPVPPHRDIQKTALGATETVSWEYEPSAKAAVQNLKAEGYKIFSVEQAEKSIAPDALHSMNHEKVALVFGNEVEGVQQEILDISDGVIEIPQMGTKHSLNVSVAAGIALWEFFRYFANRNN